MKLRTPAGAALDLRSQLYFTAGRTVPPHDIVEAVAADNDRLVHESGHWARYNGSTVGVLLTLMRRTRDVLAVGLLRSLNRSEHGRLRAVRASGVPLLTADGGGAVRGNDATDATDATAGIAHSWLCLYRANQLLLGSQPFTPAGYARALGDLDEALYSTWYQSAGHGMLPFERDVAVTGKASLVVIDGVQLTTRLLLENAALADEMYPNAIGALGHVRDKTWLRRLQKSWDGEYGTADRLVSRAAGREIDPSTLLTLIDFALNPPIPGLTQGIATIEFNDLYPPIRFMRAAQVLAASRLPTEGVRPSSAVITEALQFLASETNAPMGRIDANLTSYDGLAAAARAETSFIEMIPEMQFVHTERLLKDRDESIMTLSHYGLNFAGDGALRFVRPDQFWMEGNWWLFPPLQAVDGVYSWPADRVTIDDATILMSAMAVSAAMDDVLLRVGPLPTGHLPQREISDPRVQEFLSEDLFGMTGFELAWSV